jgi:FKBP-type peptidyl-prolyl cis-trans isomerase SlyD
MGEAIQAGKFVEFEYTLRDGRGNFIEATEGVQGVVWGRSGLIRGLEQALEGASEGDVLNVMVPPEDAYGTRDPDSIFEVPKEEFPDPESLKPGAEFVAEGSDGTSLTMHVVEVHDDHVVVDGNHPLAGETLNFQIHVRAVRAATADELLAAEAERSPIADDQEPS